MFSQKASLAIGTRLSRIPAWGLCKASLRATLPSHCTKIASGDGDTVTLQSTQQIEIAAAIPDILLK
jgi:hypothetical protein